MRKPPLLAFLFATLLAAIFAYLNNAYQERKREETRQAQAAIEQQQQEQFRGCKAKAIERRSGATVGTGRSVS